MTMGSKRSSIKTPEKQNIQPMAGVQNVYKLQQAKYFQKMSFQGNPNKKGSQRNSKERLTNMRTGGGGGGTSGFIFNPPSNMGNNNNSSHNSTVMIQGNLVIPKLPSQHRRTKTSQCNHTK